MSLMPATERVIRLVEEASRLPVIVQADPSMTLLAAVKIARGSDPAHVVTYNPRLGGSVDYAVVYQCAFVLRLFAAPESERFDFAGTWRGRKETEKLLAEHLKQNKSLNLDRTGRDKLRDQLYDGLMRQLRSVPIGLRVDAWIRQDCPELIEQQRAAIQKQLSENMMSLKPEVRTFAPPRVFEGNVAMNAAFAIYWSRINADPRAAQPYSVTQFAAMGESLLKIWEDIPFNAVNDKNLIDTWGQHLGVSGWYEFQPYMTGRTN